MVYMGEQDWETRQKAADIIADAIGVRFPRTILPPGTGLWDIGEKNKRALQGKISALPWTMDSVRFAEQRIADEQLLDVPDVAIQSMRMNPMDGRLYQDGFDPSQAVGFTKAGISHALAFIKPPSIRNGFSENILALPNKLAADVFNHWASHSRNTDKATLRTMVEPGSGTRIIRAVTSSKHSLTTGDDSAVIEMLKSQADSLSKSKMRYTREPDRSEFEIIWPAMDRQLVVGDIAYIGVRISNSETKAGCLRVEVFILRVLCANFTTAFSTDEEFETVDLRHMGDLRTKLVRAFANALKRADPFVKAFADAYKQPLTMTRGEALEKVQKMFKLGEGVVNLAGQLWDADGEHSAGDSLAGLVNAMTRASQTLELVEAGEVERAAGQLVLQPTLLAA